MFTKLFMIYLKELAFQIPLIIVSIVGIVLVIARWRRHSKVSLFTTLCLIVLLFHIIFFGPVFVVLPMMFFISYESHESFLQTIGFIERLIYAIIFALLLVAALMKRNEQNPNLEGQQT